jgi:hypothetical protein
MLTKENSNVQTPPERTGRLAKSAKSVMVAKAGGIRKAPVGGFGMGLKWMVTITYDLAKANNKL